MNAEGHEAPSEEELRARLEEELRQIKVHDLLLQSVVTLVNLGGQRLGLSGAKDVRDLDQTRTAIDAIRALLPLLEADEGGAEQMRPIRDALAQLQMAYAREVSAEREAPGGEVAGGEAQRAEAQPEPAGGTSEATPQDRGKPRPSGRLWVPPGSAS